MIGEFLIAQTRYRVDFSQAQCIAIALDFDGVQPSHFGAEPASATPMRVGDFIGDTRQGGSCNVPLLRLNPHCNGTHTESVGHIVDTPFAVHDSLDQSLFPAVLLSLTPVPAPDCGESYRPALAEDDRVITRAQLEHALSSYADEQLAALVIRTLPNTQEKHAYRYGEDGFPPFLTCEAIDYLVARKTRHLLVDFPSVDKMYDEGKLTVHHRFWNVEEDSHALTPDVRRFQTITEMVFVPDRLGDGKYLLEIQIPPFMIDAAPSRPLLYVLETY